MGSQTKADWSPWVIALINDKGRDVNRALCFLAVPCN